MESDEEWVEIKCPRTGEPMFANLTTGDCLWEPPPSAVVKECNENQWWELYDSGTGRNYYHNCTTNTTVWRKPVGADILPLSKLQAKSTHTSNKTYQKNGTSVPSKEDSKKSDPLSEPVSPDLYLERKLSSSSSTNTLDRNSLCNKLPPISPYAVKPTSVHVHTGSLKPNKHGKIPPPIASKPATLKRGTRNSITKTRGEDTPGSATENNGTDHSVAYGNSLAGDNRSNSFKKVEHHPRPQNEHLSVPHPKTGAPSIEDLSNLDSDQEAISAIDPTRASFDTTNKTSLNDKLKQNRHESRYQSFHDFSAPSKYSDGKPRISLGNDEHNHTGSTLQRRHSTEISPTPQKDRKGFGKKAVSRSPTSPIPKQAKEKEFVKKNINRPRGMFKKVSIATMLAYSKESIKKPIILTQDKDVRKCAVDYFKNLQEYMGDTRSGKNLKDRDRLKRAVELTYTGWQKKPFRDEFYMQVIKQTTCNNKPKSLEWGWKLITAYLYFFPPTTRFQGYLEGYLYKNKENDFNQGVRVVDYAEYCYDRLQKMVVRGAKPGQKKPNEDDIAHAMELPFKKSMFGATLDEVMELQRDTHPNHHLPWVLTLLAEKVLDFGGHSTEGIFRVPGDIDRVGALKVALDNGDYLKEFPTSDAPVCASLLKEWLREMYDPVIPGTAYQACLDNCKEASFCSTIINNDLPNINRLVVTFVIRFLQGFIKEDVVKQTKMTADNLAMVFAPNLLRCPSTDLQVAMDNSKWEMTFVRTLINTLDTSYMDGVV